MLKAKFGFRYLVPHDVKKIRASIDGVTQDLDVIRTLVGMRFNVETTQTIEFETSAGLLKDLPRDGLVLEFLMSEGVGTTLYDTSRVSPPNNGSIVGATWQQLATGKWVLSFDGIDDYVNVGTGLNSITQYTSLAWIKIFDYPVRNGYGIMTLGSGYNTHGFRFRVDWTKKLWLLMAENGAFTYWWSDVDVPLNQWTFVGVVGVPKSYVQLIVNETIKTISTTQGMSQPTGDTLIGSSWSATQELFKGLMGFVAVYDRALSEDEIMEIYEATRVYFRV